MANIDNLNYPSITEVAFSDACSIVAHIRFKRREVKKTVKVKAAIEKKRKAKAPPKVSKNQAEELLKLLKGTMK